METGRGNKVKKFKPYLTLIFVLIFLFVFYKLLYRDLGEPNVEFIPEMVHSTAYDAFSPNSNFPDGKTLQEPVKGTIARGYFPEYSEGPLTEETAGKILVNPLISGKSELTRGETIYRNIITIIPKGL